MTRDRLYLAVMLAAGTAASVLAATRPGGWLAHMPPALWAAWSVLYALTITSGALAVRCEVAARRQR